MFYTRRLRFGRHITDMPTANGQVQSFSLKQGGSQGSAVFPVLVVKLPELRLKMIVAPRESSAMRCFPQEDCIPKGHVRKTQQIGGQRTFEKMNRVALLSILARLPLFFQGAIDAKM